MSTEQKIADIEAEMARTQKNKATEGHLGLLKARLSKLKRELLNTAGSGDKSGEGFDVAKSGTARVGFIGFPSVGKSTLLSKLTNTVSEAADYEFTTLTCVPGTMHYNNAKIQLLDLPGIIEGAKDGKGRGKQVIGVARTCDLLLIILDATKPMQLKKIIERELEGFGIRLNKARPAIRVTRKIKGGICITKVVPQSTLEDQQIIQICKEFRIISAEIVLACDASIDDLIDAIDGNRAYVPALYVLNKIDRITMEELELLNRLPHFIPISADKEWNFDGLKRKIWAYLNLIRIYPKPKGALPDLEEPVILRENSRRVKDFCLSIHRNFLDTFKNALVWGTSVKYLPQNVGKDHVLQDEDVIQVVRN